MVDPKYVQALKLKDEGLSYAEIAERLGVRVEDARAYIHYANTRHRVLRRQRRYQRERHAQRMARLRESLGGKCDICGLTSKLEIHHIKPLLRSGNRLGTWGDMSNLRLLCKFCHEFTESRGLYGALEDYRSRLDGRMRVLRLCSHRWKRHARELRTPRLKASWSSKAARATSEAQEIRAWLARTRGIKEL